jgi:hydrogenase/urease accessory protein HupE
VIARLLALWIIALLLPVGASAHEMSIAELNLRERAPGQFQWHWSIGGTGRQPADVLRVKWPSQCRSEIDNLDCAGGGLEGVVTVEGLGDGYSALMLKVTWLGGQARVYTMTSRAASVRLYGTSEDNRSAREIGGTYTVLGVEHILGGIDHLLFVVCLLFLVGFNRRLVWTITAFTVAHSLTLIASSLGWLVFRGPPVEAVIAGSIVLMAAETLRHGDSITRRLPALVAFGFGLLHGLGFAGALAELGLPETHLLWALLSFNIGVEIGQLMIVGVALALAWPVAARLPALAARVPVTALYIIGSLAAFWTIERTLTVIGLA